MNKRRSTSVVVPRKEPKQERSRQTYQAILQGATKVIRKLGPQKFSTNKVAEESGVSIGSLYQYFPSKEAIIAALIDQSFEYEYLRMKERLNSLSPKMGAREAFKLVFSHYYIVESEDLNFRKIMINAVALAGKNEAALKFHKSMAELIIGFTQEHYKSSQAMRDPNSVVFMLQYMLRAAAHSSVDTDLDGINIANLVEDVSEALINLLRIPPEYLETLS